MGLGLFMLVKRFLGLKMLTACGILELFTSALLPLL